MEGMISSEALVIQAECVELGGCSLLLDNWAKGLAVKLLEATHGQWLYRNIQIWSCKQVTNIAGVNSNQAVYKANYDPMCPSCNKE